MTMKFDLNAPACQPATGLRLWQSPAAALRPANNLRTSKAHPAFGSYIVSRMRVIKLITRLKANQG